MLGTQKFVDIFSIMRSYLSRPLFWSILMVVTLICFASGPFGTFEHLPTGLRLIYWVIIVIAGGILGLIFGAILQINRWQSFQMIALTSICFAICMTIAVIIVSYAVLSPLDKYPGALSFVTLSFPTSGILFFFIHYLVQNIGNLPAQNNISASRAPLFARLDTYRHAKKIYALIAQDHYVEVVTEQGSELCLIRLNDAIKEAIPQEGMQIHRSHWVALEAIETAHIKGTSPHVILTTGQELKISKTYLTEAKSRLSDIF